MEYKICIGMNKKAVKDIKELQDIILMQKIQITLNERLEGYK